MLSRAKRSQKTPVEHVAASDVGGCAAGAVAVAADVSSTNNSNNQGRAKGRGEEPAGSDGGPVSAVAGVLPNPFSFLLFSWMTPVFVLGWKRPLRHSDLPLLPKPLQCAATSDKFDEIWRARTGTSENASSSSPSSPSSPRSRADAAAAAEGKAGLPLAKTLLVLNRGRVAGSLALQLFNAGLQFAGPLLLKRIVSFLQSPVSGSPGSGKQLPSASSLVSPVSLKEAYVSAFLMFLFPFIGAAASVQSSRFAATTQVRIRAQLMGALYRKAAALSPKSRARADAEAGRVVNLMSTDVATIAQFVFPFANQLVSAPLFILVALILLYNQIAWATFIGFAVLALSSPLSTRFVKIISRRRREMLQHTDRRVRLTNQLLTGIRVLKIYGWESAQEAAVLAARDAELGRLRAAIPSRVGMQTLLFAAPVLAAVTSFAAYGAASAGHPGRFTPANVFAAIALFALMRLPLILLPFALVEASNALVSARRLSQFLLLEEREGGSVKDLAGAVGLRIRGGNFYWPSEEEKGEEEAKEGKSGSKKEAGERKKQERKKEKEEKKEEGNNGDVVVELPADDGAEAEADALPTSSRASGPTGGEESAADASANAAAAAAATRSTASTRYGAAPPPGFTLPGSGSSGGGGGAANEAACYWLRDIDLDVGPGELVALVGRVGSGKSSVVSAALGNMSVARPPDGGGGDDDDGASPPAAILRGGRVALVAQGAWIANASLKDNVLFGEEFDQRKWEAAVDAACLGPDLETLPAGAATEIGEKGINLSGGQKQRVALARAAYADADLYLFDDPLSALDVHVGAAVFEKLVLDRRRRGKAVLFATNQLQFLPFADKVCYLENGRIAAQGEPDSASLKGCEGFQGLLADYEATARACGDNNGVKEAAAAAAPAVPSQTSPSSAPSASSSSLLDASVVSRTRQQRADALLPRATAGTMLPRGGSGGGGEGAASASSSAAAAAAPPTLPAASTSSSWLIRRVPTFAIEQETRIEALHAAAGGARDLNKAGGAPPLESAFARESGPRPGERGDDGGDDDEVDDERNGDDAGEAVSSAAGDSINSTNDASVSSSRRHSLSTLSSPRRDNSLGAGFLDLVNGAQRRGASFELGPPSRAASRQQSLSNRRHSSGSLTPTPSTAAANVANASKAAEDASKAAEDAAADADATAPDSTKTGGTLVRAEYQEEGAVGSAVYSFYIARYGRAAFSALLILWASEQSARVLTNWWLSRWTGAEALAAATAAASPPVDVHRMLRLGGYLGLSLAFVLFSCLRSATNLTSAARASKSVHAAALGALTRSPVSFFDQTPVGRSLNRFSRDMDDVDYLLPQSLNDAGNCVAQLASSLVFIAIVQPFFLAGLAPIVLFYYLLTVSARSHALAFFFFCLPSFFFLLRLRPPTPTPTPPSSPPTPRPPAPLTTSPSFFLPPRNDRPENLSRFLRRASAQRRRLALARLCPFRRVPLRRRYDQGLRPRAQLPGEVRAPRRPQPRRVLLHAERRPVAFAAPRAVRQRHRAACGGTVDRGAQAHPGVARCSVSD